MEIFSKMELNEVIEYIKSKNKAIVTENMNLYGIEGTVCRIAKFKLCCGYRGAEDIVFYKAVVFNHEVTDSYLSNHKCHYLTKELLDKIYNTIIESYQEANKNFKEILVSERKLEIEKDFNEDNG